MRLCDSQQLALCCLRSLFPLATVVTPNLPEAAALLGGREIADVDAMRTAARDLHALGPQNVLVKGGHLATGVCAHAPSGRSKPR